MAAGALARSPANLSVSITGVAGPDPDEDGNPVGFVCIAVILEACRKALW
jgi:nicotinamide-nucleotide amidase